MTESECSSPEYLNTYSRPASTQSVYGFRSAEGGGGRTTAATASTSAVARARARAKAAAAMGHRGSCSRSSPNCTWRVLRSYKENRSRPTLHRSRGHPGRCSQQCMHRILRVGGLAGLRPRRTSSWRPGAQAAIAAGPRQGGRHTRGGGAEGSGDEDEYDDTPHVTGSTECGGKAVHHPRYYSV